MAALNPEAPEFIPHEAVEVLPYLPISMPLPNYTCFSPNPLLIPSSYHTFPYLGPPPVSIYNNNLFLYVGLQHPDPPALKIPLCEYHPSIYSLSHVSEAELLHGEADEKIAEVEKRQRGGVRGCRRPKQRVEVQTSEEGHGKRVWVAKSTSKRNQMKQAQEQCLELGEGNTTLMIRNIPNKYTREMLLVFLDSHCMEENNKNGGDQAEEKEEDWHSAYDFVYLPMDFWSGCNLGYAFVNFTNSAATGKLYEALHKKKWDVLGSKKICEITLARIQGTDALEKHFKESIFPCESDEFLPLRFVPHRDGSCRFQSLTIGKRTARLSSMNKLA